MSNSTGPNRGITPGLPTNKGSWKAKEQGDPGLSLDPEAAASDTDEWLHTNHPQPEPGDPWDQDLPGDGYCTRCGEPIAYDPYGSPGVIVHVNDGEGDGIDHNADEDHTPLASDGPEENPLTTLMDAENSRQGAYDPLAPQNSSGPALNPATNSADVTRENLYETNRKMAHDAIADYDEHHADPHSHAGMKMALAGLALATQLKASDDNDSRDAGWILDEAQRGYMTRLNNDGHNEEAGAELRTALRNAITYGDHNLRHFGGKSAAEWKEEARAARQRSAESFERSDTDGFLSQWASDKMASKYDYCADLAAHGGRSSFPALFDLDGKPVPAKQIETRYGLTWMLLDENGKSTGEFVNPSKSNSAEKRATAMSKKGYRTGRVLAPMALNSRTGDPFRADDGWSPDNEVDYVIGADGTNPRRAEVEAEGGEFNEWYDQ
jgi:hypothetical protein